ncbi:MAG: transposase, partial [Thermotogaceae bacterium]|nr:transposase [Thermotogaceae bacterium]
MEFTVIDVETANPDMSSICQIGIAKYEDFSL